MPHSMQHDPGYVVNFRGLEIKCADVDHVIEAVKALMPLEREVEVPTHAEPAQDSAPAEPSSIALAVQELFRESPDWRRPVEIVKALRRKRIPGTKYTTVYAALRYGRFVKREGKWNVAEAA